MRGRRPWPFRLAALVAAPIFASCAAAADASYHIGNSLTWDMYVGGLQEIAGGFGVSLTPGYHIRNAGSLVQILRNPGDVSLDSPSIWSTALPSQSWNFLTFQPYPDPNSPSTLQTDITAAQTFIGLVPGNSGPAPVFYVYEAWPNQNEFQADYDAYWNQTVPDNLEQRTILARQYFDALFQRLTAQYGDTATIRVIPVGDVFARINQLIASGQFEAAGDITDFYRDTHHMGTAGKFTAAITAFATMYRRNPAGAAFTTLVLRPTEGAIVLTPQVAAELERIVWDVVTSESTRTGVYPIDLRPVSLTFPSTQVGASDQPQMVVLSNVTGRPIAIDAISVTGNFREATTCGSSLPANAECAVTVTFAPSVAGAHSGTLTIRSADATYTVPLSGTAPVDATISASTVAATVGQNVTLTWTASAGAICEAQNGVPGSAWGGSVAVSGTRTITESTAASVTYSLRCSSSGVADTSASTIVVWSWPRVDVSDRSGGGGATDLFSLVAAGLLCCRRHLRRGNGGIAGPSSARCPLRPTPSENRPYPGDH